MELSDEPLTGEELEELKALTERDPGELTDAEVTAKLRLSLRRRFSPPEWRLMFQYGAPGNSGRVIDCLGCCTVASRNYPIVAFELKANRSDWLREVRDETKADYFVRLADEFYVVAPKGVVQESELPTGWGYLEMKPNSERLYKQVDSNLTENQVGDPPRRFWVRLLDAVTAGAAAPTGNELFEARRRGYEEAKQEGISDRMEKRELDKLRRKAANWDTLDDAGFDFLTRYTFDDDDVRVLELAFRIAARVDSDRYGSLLGSIERLDTNIRQNAERMLDELEELESEVEALRELLDSDVPSGVVRGVHDAG